MTKRLLRDVVHSKAPLRIQPALVTRSPNLHVREGARVIMNLYNYHWFYAALGTESP